MRKIFFFLISIALLSCDNNDTEQTTIIEKENYIIINGIEKSLISGTDQPGVAISFGSGPYNNEGQNFDLTYYDLTINDPSDFFFNIFNIDELYNSLQVRFIIKRNTLSESRYTVPEVTSNFADNSVISNLLINHELFINADSNQNILLSESEIRTVIEFQNIHYGDYTITGKFVIPSS